MKTSSWAIRIGFAAVMCAATIGCAPQVNTTAAPPPVTVAQNGPANGPSAAVVAAQRAMASQMMTRARAQAKAEWTQHNPGKPLPLGL